MNVTANFVTDDIFNQYTALIVSVESICTKDNKKVFAQKVELNHSDANQLQVWSLHPGPPKLIWAWVGCCYLDIYKRMARGSYTVGEIGENNKALNDSSYEERCQTWTLLEW